MEGDVAAAALDQVGDDARGGAHGAPVAKPLAAGQAAHHAGGGGQAAVGAGPLGEVCGGLGGAGVARVGVAAVGVGKAEPVEGGVQPRGAGLRRRVRMQVE